MGRMMWFAAGVAVGAYGYRVAVRKARSYTPEGLAARATDSAHGVIADVLDFIRDVSAASSQRQAELNHAIGLVDGASMATYRDVQTSAASLTNRAAGDRPAVDPQTVDVREDSPRRRARRAASTDRSFDPTQR